MTTPTSITIPRRSGSWIWHMRTHVPGRSYPGIISYLENKTPKHVPCCQAGPAETLYPYQAIVGCKMCQLLSPYRDLVAEMRLRDLEEQRLDDDGCTSRP